MNFENEQPMSVEQVEEEIFDLETLITDGTDNFVPLKFIYPGKDKAVGVYVRPITTVEFTNASRNPRELITNVVKTALYDRNKQKFPPHIIDKMAAGVTIELYKKIAEISGIPTTPDDNVSNEMMDKLMGF